MTLVRVPIAGTIGKAIRINSDATVGAQISVDVSLPDGTVPSLAELADALYAASPPKEFINPEDPSDGGAGFVFESDVIDGIILARVADNERITGMWQFDSLLMTNAAAIEWLNFAGSNIEFLNFEGMAGGEVEIDHFNARIDSDVTVTDDVSFTTMHTIFSVGALVDGDDYLVVAKTWFGCESGASQNDNADVNVQISYGATTLASCALGTDAFEVFPGSPGHGVELSAAKIITADASSTLISKAQTAPSPDNDVRAQYLVTPLG